MSTLYFAYGSNMDAEAMRGRCPGARLLGPGVLWGWRFRINGRGYATVVPENGAMVHGVLWELGLMDETRLDAYEAVAEGLYYKVTVPVEHSLEATDEAMVYVAADEQPGAPLPGYLEDLVAAAGQHGFPCEYLAELAAWR